MKVKTASSADFGRQVLAVTYIVTWEFFSRKMPNSMPRPALYKILTSQTFARLHLMFVAVKIRQEY